MRIHILTLQTLLCIASVWMLAFPLSGQVRPGIKFGLSTPDVNPSAILVTDPAGIPYYNLFVEQARYGVHAGAFIQMQIGGFFIQPEILYNSTSIDYRIDSLFTGGMATSVVRDKYRQIDFPVMLGLKSGPIRLGGGPVAHLHLDSAEGLADYPGFQSFFEDLTWGWQAGLGLDFWKVHIDVRYEGNFSPLGEQITFFGEKFDFATNNNRLIASLGFSF